jgi:hypothetical protein
LVHGLAKAFQVLTPLATYGWGLGS